MQNYYFRLAIIEQIQKHYLLAKFAHMKLNSQLQLRIDWSELDLFGHVNNVMYFKYIQAARVHFWQAAGIYQQFEQDNSRPYTCQYRLPIY